MKINHVSKSEISETTSCKWEMGGVSSQEDAGEHNLNLTLDIMGFVMNNGDNKGCQKTLILINFEIKDISDKNFTF